jgi:hypothetical protein
MTEVKRNTDDTTVHAGDHLVDHLGTEWIYQGIASMPTDHYWYAGWQPGRLTVTNRDGSEQRELYPPELNVRIVD